RVMFWPTHAVARMVDTHWPGYPSCARRCRLGRWRRRTRRCGPVWTDTCPRFHTRAAEHECHHNAGENGRPSMLRVHGVSPRFYEHDSTSSNLDQQATCSLLDDGLD